MRRRRYVVLGLVAALAFAWAVVTIDPSVDGVLSMVESVKTSGVRGLLGYVAIYGLVTWGLGPASWLQGSAGFLWGVPGIGVAWALSLVFGFGSYAAARGRLRAPVTRVLEQRGAAGRLAALDRAIARRGVLAVALLRLSPMSPYNFVSYMLGVTGVDTRSYLLGTAVGSVVPAIVWGTLGSLASDLASLGDTGGSPAAAIAIAATTLLASAGIAVFVKRALDEGAASADPPAAGSA